MGFGLKCMFLSACQFWSTVDLEAVVPVFLIGVLKFRVRKLYFGLWIGLDACVCWSLILALSFSFS